MSIKSVLTTVCILGSVFPATVSGYAFVANKNSAILSGHKTVTASRPSRRSTSSLQMIEIDQQTLMGGGIALAGVVAGIGLVAFTEVQGERAKARGSGLSDDMSTRITGGLMEDVEVSSVSDLGSLTSQLEEALRESGGAKEDDFEMDEAAMKRMTEDAEDGW